jgi:polyisoprenoid-binding protein YceI
MPKQSYMILALLLVGAGTAEARLVKHGSKANVIFTAKGPAGLTITGSTADLQITDDGKRVSISVPLRALTTGIVQRDQHMKDKYLQVSQFPAAELSIERGALKPPSSGAVSADVKALMKIHGKTKTITIHYAAKKTGDGAIQVVGTTTLDIRDYGIEIPKFMGVTVKPDVSVAVTFDAKDS